MSWAEKLGQVFSALGEDVVLRAFYNFLGKDAGPESHRKLSDVFSASH